MPRSAHSLGGRLTGRCYSTAMPKSAYSLGGRLTGGCMAGCSSTGPTSAHATAGA